MSFKFWMLLGVFLFLGCSLMDANVLAATSSTSGSSIAAAVSYCTGLRSGSSGSSPGLTLPLIQCFTDQTNGVIITAVTALIGAINGYYVAPVKALCIVLVGLLGIRMIAGFGTQEVKSEMFLTVFKIAGIWYFLGEAPAKYQQIIGIIQGLSDDIATASVSSTSGGFCVAAVTGSGSTGAGDQIWGQLDCMITYLFGLPTSATTFTTLGIVSFLLMMFISKGAGGAILAIGTFMLLRFITLIWSFVKTYIESIMAFSFLFWFGYLFVPLLMFRGTYRYFEQWLNLCFGYLLRPIMMLGFMGISLVILDNVFFSAPYSILQRVSGSSAYSSGGGSSTSTNAFQTLVTNTSNQVDCPVVLFFLNYNPVAKGKTFPNPCNPDPLLPNPKPIGSLDSTSTLLMDGGIVGAGLQDTGIPGSSLALFNSGSGDPIWLPFKGLKLASLATAAGVTDTTNPGGTYLSGVLDAIATSALIIYILFALVNKIDDIVSGLVKANVGGSKSVEQGDVAKQVSKAVSGGAQKIVGNPMGGGG